MKKRLNKSEIALNFAQWLQFLIQIDYFSTYSMMWNKRKNYEIYNCNFTSQEACVFNKLKVPCAQNLNAENYYLAFNCSNFVNTPSLNCLKRYPSGFENFNFTLFWVIVYYNYPNNL